MLKKRLVTLFLAFSPFVCAAGPISAGESFKIQGIDVRSKEGDFTLEVSEENLVLQERTFVLSKMQNGKKKVMAQGGVILKHGKTSEDASSFWIGDEVELKIGPLTGSGKPKQIIVLRLKNMRRTFAFEIYR